jgi:hypothetical protein
VNQIIRIGMDTSKHFFQLHGVDAAEQVVLRRKLRRDGLLAFFAKLPPRSNRPDIWMQAIRSDQKKSCGTGAVHIWVPAFAGTIRGEPASFHSQNLPSPMPLVTGPS